MPQAGGDVQNFLFAKIIVSREIKKALQQVFIREWNNQYPADWDNTRACGRMLYNMEQARLRSSKTSNEHLKKIQSGDTADWDCTILIDAILYSNAIGRTRLDLAVGNAVNNLRVIRNSVEHVASERMSDSCFDRMIAQIQSCFLALGISNRGLNETIQKRSKYTSFEVYPEVSKRASDPELDEPHETEIELDAILDEIISNYWQNYLRWVSLGPLSSRLPLHMIGQRWFKRENVRNIRNTFVMTLDGTNEETMLQSYADFASHVRCDKDAVSDIMKADVTKEEKIFSLKSEVKSQVKEWNSWLIMVTDVEDFKTISRYLPQPGEEGWKNGQILMTANDGLWCLTFPGRDVFT